MSVRTISLLLLFGCFISMNAQQTLKEKSAFDFKLHTGVNVSHWLSQSSARGEERRRYITRADFDTIASLGFDHVRIPIDEEQFWDSLGNQRPEAFELLDNAVRWSFAAGLRVIVDLHIIRSHYFNNSENRLWSDTLEQQKLTGLWLQLSEKLKKYPDDKLAYEILNEAVADDPEDWNRLLNRIIAAIRTKESGRIIVVGSNRWQIPDTFPDLRIPEKDPNIILSFHFYTPLALTHHTAPWSSVAEYSGPVNYPGLIVDSSRYKNLSAATVEFMRRAANGYFDKKVLEEKMMPAIKVAGKYGLPLFCGEYGVYPKIPIKTMLDYYSDICAIFNENKIAHCHWCYRGDFPIVDADRMPNRKLVEILTSK
jgi:endoglucanase